MKTALQKIAADVAALIGEPLIPECEPEESPIPGFADRLRIMVPAILSSLIQEAPKASLTGWASVAGTPLIDSRGVATVELPDDFIRFGSIRLSGWAREVDSVLDETDSRIHLQGSGTPGIGGNSERPAAVFGLSASGIRSLKLYTCAEDARIEYFHYFSRPAWNADDTVEIPETLYPALLSALREAFSLP